MAISSITRSDGANYAFQINLDTAFAEATTIRWEIHPTAGKFPLALTAPLIGTLDFSTSETSKMVSPALTRNHPFPRDFEIQLYNVADDTLAFTSSEQRIAGDASLPDNSRSISGGGDQNVIGLGLSDTINPASGGSGDDTFIITRFQYGTLEIDDVFTSLSGQNLIKFDYGVTITAYREVSFTLFDVVIDSVTLTLSTGAVVTIALPAGSFGYQLGSGEVLTYAAFKAAIGATGESGFAGDFTILVSPVEFTSTNTAMVVENNNAGAMILTVQATSTHANGDDSPITSYMFLDENDMPTTDHQGFTIDNNGRITVDNRLDYDADDATLAFTLRVIATDTPDPNVQGDEAETATQTIIISLGDANDNLPVFAQSTYTANIDETHAVGSEIARVAARDADGTATNNQVTYSITAGNVALLDDAGTPTGEMLFSIDSNGVITLNAPLDFETATSYALTIGASDGLDANGDAHTTADSTATVNITITDVNDSPPRVSGDSGTGTAMLIEAGAASTNTDTGYFITLADDDTDAVNRHEFTILGGEASRFAFVKDDTTANQWNLVLLAGQTVDREADRASIALNFQVTDANNRPLTALSTTVAIIDANDHAPTIRAFPTDRTPPIRPITLNERPDADTSRTPIVVEGLTIALDDADATTAHQSITPTSTPAPTFTVLNASDGAVNEKFQVVHDNGNWVLQYVDSVLDAVATPSFEVIIQVSDGVHSTPVKSDPITLSVINVDEGAASFEVNPTQANENILEVEVATADPDGLNGIYSFQWFTTTDNGMTQSDIAGANDRAFDTTDRTDPTGTVYGVRVEYIDHADTIYSEVHGNAPFAVNMPLRFTESYSITLNDGNASPTLPTFAVELNGVAFTDATYAFATDGNPGAFFDLTSAGVLTLKAAVDFDTATDAQKSFNLRIKATASSGETAIAMIPVSVMDANDNTPSITATDDMRKATGVLVDDVVDSDPGVSFKIIDADSNRVNAFGSDITSTTHPSLEGRFTLTFDTTDPTAKTAKLVLESGRKIDREELGNTDTISLNVKVTDGQATSTDGVAVTLTITDINDSPPRVSGDSGVGTARLVEAGAASTNTDTGYFITLADDDTDAVNRHEFRILGGEASRFAFVEDGTTANQWNLVLLAGQTVDREDDGASIALNFQVTDANNRPLTALSTTVAIIDTNDNEPKFAASTYTLSVSEDDGLGDKVGAPITAMDPDSVGMLFYSIYNDPDNLFKVEGYGNGQITVNGYFDYETTKSYTVTLEADDDVHTPATTTIIINVEDANDNQPTLTIVGTGMLHELPASTEATDTGITFTIDDADKTAGVNPAVTEGFFTVDDGRFDIVAGDNAGEWKLVLLAGKTVTYDADNTEIYPQVSIYDWTSSGEPADDMQVTIAIAPPPNQVPVFADNPLSWVTFVYDNNVLLEDTPEGSPLATINASDPDGNNGNDLEFRIVGGDGTFTIYGDELYLNKALDYETAQSHQLTLRVLDDDGGSADTDTPITINIGDVNDNPPTMTLSGDEVINERRASDTDPIVAGITITIADADATDAHKSSVSGEPGLDFTVYDEDGTTVNNDYAVVRKAGGAVNEYQLQHTGDVLDASATSSVSLEIGVTDGVNSDPPQLPVTLSVNHVDEGDVMALELDAVYEQHPVTKEITTFAVPSGFAGATLTLSSGTLDNDLFTIRDGKLWWISTPDYESPADADRDNVYEIEVTFTKTDDTTTRQRYDLEVQDIGPGRYDYGSGNPDGGAWSYFHHRSAVPLPKEPGGLSNYILHGHAFVVPETGPLILTWAHDPDSDYTAAQVRPIVERAFALYEAAANFKFIEVDWSASKDIEMLFNQGANTGSAKIRHDFRAQVDRIRISPQTIEDLETDHFDIVTHEIGHILGLKHPFDEFWTRVAGWSWDQDHLNNPNTIMSYYDFDRDPNRGGELLPADIAALHFLYGPPEGTVGAEDWEPPHWLVRSNQFRYPLSPGRDPIFISETVAAGTELYTITVENNFLLRFSNPPTPDRSEYELPNGSSDNEFFQLDSDTGVLSLKQKLDYGNPLDKGDVYFYAGNNVYEVRISGEHFFDDEATQAIWGNSIFAQRLPIVVLESIDLAQEGLTDINLVTRGAAKTPTDYGGKEVIGTDGVNRISDGHGYDIIRGNGNDDIITLTTTPKDENEVIYRIGNQVAIDGGDQVIGFEHGKDKLILALPENMATSAITNFAGFVSHINGGTSTDLTDDWFGVKLVTDAGKTMLQGLSFHFEKIVVGAGSISVMHITFSTSLPLSDALGSATLASITNSDGFLTDFGLLDDLLGGEQSFKFITEEFTIPTNTMVVGAALNDSDPSSTAADDLLGGAVFLGFEII